MPLATRISSSTASRPSKAERRYAVKSEILRAVGALKATGVPVVAVDLRPDGSIRLTSAMPTDEAVESEFDFWDKAGKL